MRIRHYAQFRSQMRDLDWDRLRNDSNEASYHVPFDRETYLKRVEAVVPGRLTDAIASFVHEHDIETILSVGAGIGVLEYQLRASVDRVIVTDITDSIERLASFGVFDDAFRFDVIRDPMPETRIDLALLPRIDTEFTDDQFRAVFAKFGNHGVRYICLEPGALLNLRMILVESRVWLRSLVAGKRPAFCGYFRDLRGLEKAWRGYYRMVECDKSVPVIFLEVL